MPQQPPDEHLETPRAQGMPVLGLGTWQNDDPEQAAESVRTALEVGYRHVDTAQAYDNEEAVGEGIASADVDRDEVFLATKVWKSNLAHDDVLRTARESLDRLDTDYVDLLYVHWPSGEYDAEETLSAFAELKDEGDVEHVGVSNFEPEHLDTAREVLGEAPFANQVECHPLLPQEELQEYVAGTDTELVAYSPLARGAVFDVEEIREVADRHEATPAQVSLAWLREKGITAIPKATGRDHIVDNYNSLRLDLTEEEVETIDAIDRRNREVDPSFAPW